MVGDVADSKPTSTSYNNIGGINQKASDHTTGPYQFLDLRNVDFDVPNALQKRPGQSLVTAVGTSGPISSLFEFIKLDGSSYVVAGSDTAMFYLAAGAYTLLSAGWNNGQPADMLTFVNKLWIANGQRAASWTGSTLLPFGLPVPPPPNGGATGSISRSMLRVPQETFQSGVSFFLIGGATHKRYAGTTYTSRGMFMAYSYLRTDGYMGPIDFTKAVNIPRDQSTTTADGLEYVGGTYSSKMLGFTYPPNSGITAVAVWIAVDSISQDAPFEALPGTNTYEQVGSVGFLSSNGISLAPNSNIAMGFKYWDPDLSRFWLYTLLPVSNLFYAFQANGGYTALAMTFTTGTDGFQFNDYTGIAPAARSFSAMGVDFFTSYTPKYIEVNQNIFFGAGYSAAPSTVWFSEIGEPEIYLPESSFEVRTDDGDRILALKQYQNQVIVFKETSFHKITGDSADTFQLIQLSGEFGCMSNRAVIEAKNDLYFLDRRGIVKFNGASWELISVPVEGVFRRMNLSAAREKASAVHHLYRNQIWFGIPVDGSTSNNLTVVFDYLLNAWTFFDGFAPASFAYMKSQLDRPTAWRGDYSGMIHYYGSSFFNDSGVGITCLTRSRFENYGGQNETSCWRRFFLDVAPAIGLTGTINGRVFTDYDQSTVQATFSMYQTAFQSRAEMGPVGKAVSAEISHFSASLPLLINGHAWAKRPLRNV